MLNVQLARDIVKLMSRVHEAAATIRELPGRPSDVSNIQHTRGRRIMRCPSQPYVHCAAYYVPFTRDVPDKRSANAVQHLGKSTEQFEYASQIVSLTFGRPPTRVYLFAQFN